LSYNAYYDLESKVIAVWRTRFFFIVVRSPNDKPREFIMQEVEVIIPTIPARDSHVRSSFQQEQLIHRLE
jgi:hypothetical protein